jgi:hypothetical protein
MKKTALQVRCVPRVGCENTEVRTLDLDLPHDTSEATLHNALCFFFASQGISDAVYAVDVDHYGFFAVINDEAYEYAWGTPLL